MMGRGTKTVEFNYEEIKEAIRESSTDSAIYIGADSQRFAVRGTMMAAYVTVVIIHHGSKHGGSMFKQVRIERDYGQIRYRLMNEVMMASETAMQLTDVIGNRPFEIHLDISPNPDNKSSSVIKEAIGYIKGTIGIDPVVKPDAFAASTISDRFTKKVRV